MAGLLARDSSSGRLPGLSTSDIIALCPRLQRRVRGGLVPIPPQGAIFVGSSSAPQRTLSTSRRLNPRRLDIILDLNRKYTPLPYQALAGTVIRYSVVFKKMPELDSTARR